MNKYTLYNLARVTAPPTASRTFFQQKWTAKSISRAYHGEYIREGQWTRMFDRRAPAVVPMNAGYLAGHDGSDQSAGRGSGRQIAPVDPAEEGKRKEGDKKKKAEIKKPDRTPYMQMVYHPIERRLDFAVYRSLFASSAKQARQMVLHGYVTVNGKKVRAMITPTRQFNGMRRGGNQADTPHLRRCNTQATSSTPATYFKQTQPA